MKSLALALLLCLAACSRHDDRAQVTVTYYFIPGCFTCAKMQERLHKVVAPYGNKVAFRAVDNTTAEGRDAAKRYDLGSHGVVVSDDRGQAPKIDFVEKDHRVYPEHVAGALERLLPGTVATSSS